MWKEAAGVFNPSTGAVPDFGRRKSENHHKLRRDNQLRGIYSNLTLPNNHAAEFFALFCGNLMKLSRLKRMKHIHTSRMVRKGK
jgi:hypothetical protein